MYIVYRLISVLKTRFITMCKAHNWHIKQQKFFLSRQGPGIYSSYYIHGPWRDKNNFCCFYASNMGHMMSRSKIMRRHTTTKRHSMSQTESLVRSALMKLLPTREDAFLQHLQRRDLAAIIDNSALVAKSKIPPFAEYDWALEEGKLLPDM